MRSLIFLLLLSFNATAALYDRGNGLIYDDVLDITWLQDANYAQTSGYDSDGRMNWEDGKLWVEGLVYNGHTEWRLPSISLGSGGELKSLFYDSLECPSMGDQNSLATNCNINYSLFQNLQPYDYKYFETTNGWDYVLRGALFSFGNGQQYPDYYPTYFETFTWPVHDGDIGNPVPLPAGIYLFLSGLVGLGLMRGRRSQ